MIMRRHGSHGGAAGSFAVTRLRAPRLRGLGMHALHPVLRLFIEQPQLAAEHASAYAALFAQDSAAAAAQWQRRVVLKLACGAGPSPFRSWVASKSKTFLKVSVIRL